MGKMVISCLSETLRGILARSCKILVSQQISDVAVINRIERPKIK